MAPPVISLSATSTILLFFDLRETVLDEFFKLVPLVAYSGMIAASAPGQSLVQGKKPASRPNFHKEQALVESLS